MSVRKYRVQLSPEERQELKALVSRGRAAAYRQTHARILLLSDEVQGDVAMKDEEIARSLQIGSATVERVRRRCVEEGVEAALGRREQLRRREKKLDGSGEAHLIALACGEPPEGRASWTLKLLADRLVEREISISPETVRQTLKKRTQALAERMLVHPAPGNRGVRVRHGRRAGSLPSPVWGTGSPGMPGRGQQTAGAGDPPAETAPARGCQGLRLRAQRREQPVHACARVAPGGVTDRRPGSIGRGWSSSWWTWTMRTKTG